MIRKIGTSVVVVLVALSLVVLTRPALFHIERQAQVAAPPEVVFALVNDFQQWPRWSPYEKRDPAMKREYAGPSAGEGAVYAWDGNDEIGAGKMTLTGSVPNQRIAIRLEFSRPMEATNEVVFSFEPAAEGTRVVWGMDGRNGFLGKLISMLIDMDEMVGADFEAGLSALKAAAEADARRSS